MADLSESYEEQLSRVRLMASGSETWDLSENDTTALRAVLDRLDSAEKLREERDEMLGCLRLVQYEVLSSHAEMHTRYCECGVIDARKAVNEILDRYPPAARAVLAETGGE